MKKILPVLASTAALISFSAAAQAENTMTNDHGFYVGGNYGYVKIDGQDSFDDHNDVKEGVLGYRLNPYLAVEGSYIDFGDYGNSLASASTDGYTAALKAILPLGDRLELFAKGGQLWYRTDYKTAVGNNSNDDKGVFAGAGVGFKVTENFLLNAQYTWYDTKMDAKDIEQNGTGKTNTDFKQATVGAEYRF